MLRRSPQPALAAVRLSKPWARRTLASPRSTGALQEIDAVPPPRPSLDQERFANRLFLALSPRVQRLRSATISSHLEPYEELAIESAGGTLAGVWFPATESPRGVVLMVHPWVRWGQRYFHRRGRLGALRAAGYHVLTFDLSGFGASSARRSSFFDRDVEAALAVARERAGDLPVHLWGVSCGGYWAHPVLSREAVSGAVFEDVAQHLLEWSGRMAPWGWPCYQFFRKCLSPAYRFMDLRRHTPHLRARAIAYVSGAGDQGVLPSETRELADLTGGRYFVVPDAGHLESIKKATEEVLDFALETFELAEKAAPGNGAEA